MRGKRRRKPSGQAARNAAADMLALRRRERGFYRARRQRRETLLGSFHFRNDKGQFFSQQRPSFTHFFCKRPQRSRAEPPRLFCFAPPCFSLPCVRGEQALSCLSGLPQKSHGEFCGKRSGRRIRSCGKRSAPQPQTPCRDEVWLWPPANLEMAHGACHFRAPAQMRSRCVGRGAARSLPREKVSRCPKACRGSEAEGLFSPTPRLRESLPPLLPPSLTDLSYCFARLS